MHKDIIKEIGLLAAVAAALVWVPSIAAVADGSPDVFLAYMRCTPSTTSRCSATEGKSVELEAVNYDAGFVAILCKLVHFPWAE